MKTKSKSKDKKKPNIKSQIKTEEEEEIPDPIDYDLEDEIHSIAIDIIKLHKSGKLLKDIPLQTTKEKMFKYFQYIFSKRNRKEREILIVKHYISKFPKYSEIPESKEKSQMLTKICQCLKFEKKPNGHIICCLGEPGDKFYILFKGIVTVLIPQEYDFEITERDYTKHLRRLYRMEEFEILERTIYSNMNIKSNVEFFELISNINHHIKDHRVPINDYLDRIMPITAEEKENEENKIPKLKVKLWNYKKVCDIYAGGTFGEVALMDDYSKRSASIITIEPCIFGTIYKDDYQEFIREAEEKMRKNNIINLLSHSLFINVREEIFIKHNYFNLFRYIEFNQGEYIFNKGNKREQIYFIKEGVVNIEMNGSISFINNIINSFGYNINDKQLEKLIKNNSNFRNLYNSVNYYRVFNVDKRDIIGLDEYCYNGKYFLSAKVTSIKCTLFVLEMDFLELLLKDSVIRENYKNLIPYRVKFMLNRLLKIKNTFLQRYFEFIENDEKYYMKKIDFLPYNNNKLKDFSKRALRIQNTRYNNLSPLINNMSRNSSKDFEIYKLGSMKRKNLYISTYPKKNSNSTNQNSFNSSIMSNENVSLTRNIKNISVLNSTRIIKNNFLLPGIDLHKINIHTEGNNKSKEIDKEIGNEKEELNIENYHRHQLSNGDNIKKYIEMKNDIVNKLIDSNSLTSDNFDINNKKNAADVDFLAFDKYVEKVHKKSVFYQKKKLGWNAKKSLKNKFKFIPIE